MRNLDIFNECALLLVCYHIMVFTNLTYFAWLRAPWQTPLLGYSLILCVVLVIILSTAVILIEDILQFKHWLRIRALRKKRSKFLTERD